MLKHREPVGRRLDFLLQELNREANTLGSKSVDSRTSNAAVALKVLIDDFEVPVLFHNIVFRALVPAEAVQSLEYIPGGFDVQYGREVGSKIRFNDETSRDTVIKVMTDGILLADTQTDPDLRRYNCIIIDD